MNKSDLGNFHIDQMGPVIDNRDRLLKQGYVKSYQDVYPDIYKRIHNKRGIAYIRGRVSIKLMAILYDVVIVYIPPISKKQLEERFYLDNWGELIDLCKQGIVIPIIGKAESYTASHFNDLFKNLPNSPCSLWARGIALLDVFGMQDVLSNAKEILPIDDIANDEKIFASWAKKYSKRKEDYIKKRIQEDVAVQYADLCIFGCRSEAESLLELPPPEIYKNLRLLNEIQTYPILFGLESQANFELSKLAEISSMPLKPRYYIPQSIPPNELEILYKGIGIDVDHVSTSDIIQYHNDGLGNKLRAALSDFNEYFDTKVTRKSELTISEVYSRAERFQNELKKAIVELTNNRLYQELDASQRNITKYLTIGTVTVGAALVATNPEPSSVLSVASLIGSGVAIIEAMPEKLADFIVKTWASGSHSKFVGNMWSARKLISGK